MNEELSLAHQDEIESRIFTIRGMQVMLDSHLAEMYGIETKMLNRAVKRNMVRFPESFRFQLTNNEYENLKFHIGISGEDSLRFQNGTLKEGRGKHRKYFPYVFTEQGVAMLSAVLRSETAVKVSLQVIQAFVQMRRFIGENAGLFQRLDRVERKQIESDEKFERLFDALQSKDDIPAQGIFFDGQVFDAWKFVSDLIRSAKSSLVLIDNYVDDSVLQLLTKRNKGVTATIYTQTIKKQMATDLEKHNTQYDAITIKEFKGAHDRFLIIDGNELYHIGASLKDLGKKWFAFSKMDAQTLNLLKKIDEIR